jgi:glycosyltransferase involved in cell wall biosynthesis
VKNVLVLTVHRKDRAPSQRFRIEQYLNYLEQNGFKIDFSNLLSERDDKIVYSKGNTWEKFKVLIRNISKRIKDIQRAKKYDIIFIQRRGFLLGTTFFEKRIINRSDAKVIYDFDDAVWILQRSDANRFLSRLKNPNITRRFIKQAHFVIAGNKYLADYASNFNDNVQIIPTTIDTEKYIPAENKSGNGKVCIGWSGSFSTIEHFEHATDSLKVIKEKYPEVVFKVIGDGKYKNENLEIEGIPWKKEDEVSEISSFDIGIMPLPNEEWTKGKCGLKGLQYMALQVPTVMSPVGVNMEIIEHGENGFLADTTEEWIEILSKLIESRELRENIGRKGRQTVLNHYSVEANKEIYLRAFNEL